jgi:N-methylhydantoinase B/oxoprolinase/acetone carboxylase alpha subunit
LPREPNLKETIVLDSWTNQGVLYTINATPGAGGIITAEKEDEKTLYSRIVSKQVTREEAENLFAVDFAK